VITYLGFRLIEGVLARLPRRLAYAIGVVTSTLAFPLLARQRKALESNLHHVLPAMPGPQLRKLAWRNWLNYTKAWIDFFKIPRMDRRKLGALLSPMGLENLDAAMASGKGVIVVAPHMGSWELAAASWAASFGEIGVMVEQIEPRRLFDHVSALRSRMNIRVIPLSRTGARDIMRMLKERRMVVLAMDRDILNTGQPFKFFGRFQPARSRSPSRPGHRSCPPSASATATTPTSPSASRPSSSPQVKIIERTSEVPWNRSWQRLNGI